MSALANLRATLSHPPRIAIVGLVLGCLLLCSYGMWRALDYPVAHVVMSGVQSEAEREQLQALLGDVRFTGVLSTDIEPMLGGLAEIGWAHQITVRRLWPDTLELNVVRAEPVARWGDREYLSASATVLQLPDSYRGLPRFDAVLATPQQVMQTFRLLSQVLTKVASNDGSADAWKVVALSEDAQGQWLVEVALAERAEGAGELTDRESAERALSERYTIALGSQALAERLARSLRVLSAVPHRSDVAQLDARYPSGVAVRMKPPLADGEMISQVQAGPAAACVEGSYGCR